MANGTMEQAVDYTLVNMDGVPHLGRIRFIDAPKSQSYKSPDGWPSGPKAVCIVCGREVVKAKSWVVHEIYGGGTLLHPDDEDNFVTDSGDLCTQYIGPDCYRRFSQLKEYAVK